LFINFSEFSFAIKSVNKNSVSGYDKINYVIIDRLPEIVKRDILDIYNDVLITRCFLAEWREYLCFFILKANDEQVRSINMSPYFLKLLKKILNERLKWWLEHTIEYYLIHNMASE